MKRQLLSHGQAVENVWECRMISNCVFNQARNQLGTQRGAKSFLEGGPNFK